MHELRNFKPDLFHEEQYVFEELVTKEITLDEEEEKEMKKKENQQRLRMDNGRSVTLSLQDQSLIGFRHSFERRHLAGKQ